VHLFLEWIPILLQAEKLKPGTWKDNLLYIAKVRPDLWHKRVEDECKYCLSNH